MDIEFDSIWALGCDCLAQRVISQFTPEYIGNGPFAWAAEPYLQTSYDLLTTPSLRVWERKDLVPYNYNPFHGTVDKRTGWRLGHHWSNSGLEVTEALLAEQSDKVQGKLARRFERIFTQLNDAIAKPLLIWIGYGPFLWKPLISRWQAAVDFDITGHYYDLDEAKEFLGKMRKAFPADIRMVYLAYQKGATDYQMTYIDEHLAAGIIPTPYNKRIGHESDTSDAILQRLELWKHVVKADTYETRLEAGWENSNYRSCLLYPAHKEIYLTLNLATKTGRRRKSEEDEFAILAFVDRVFLRLRWFWNQREETWFCMEGNIWKKLR